MDPELVTEADASSQLGVARSGRSDCEGRDGDSLKNIPEGGDIAWGWGSPRACARTSTLEGCFSASSSPEDAPAAPRPTDTCGIRA